MTVLYTIGHSRHAPEDFLDLLRGSGVTALADVRSYPHSRWPQFRQDNLARSLQRAGIRYVFLGDSLGGKPKAAARERAGGQIDYAQRRKAADFQAGIDRLIACATAGVTAMMCAEEDPAHCHRRSLIAPALLARGVEVIHIRGDGRLEPEPPSDGAPQLSLFAE